MAKLNEITKFLDKELRIRSIKDESKNGLQLKGKPEVKKIVAGVDACLELFEKAAEKNADMIIVHHGLLWGKNPLKRPREILRKRISLLKNRRISLYACHLPLDVHPRLGNNFQLSLLFKIKNPRPFADYHGKKIGFYGDMTKPMKIKEFIKYVAKTLGKPKTLLFGSKIVKKLGIISGGGSSALMENIAGIDTLLLGEHNHSAYHYAKERKINVVSAGHYITETFGIKAVTDELKKMFDVETEFIDIPTGL
ncbi:MAG: Nif3-like dinuclear metal center hexameric protein [Candidatus Micrarchaeia archaeon]